MLHIIICTSIILVLAFILSGKIKNILLRTLFVFASCIVITPILYFTTSYGIANIATNTDYTPFDKEKWFNDKGNRYKYSILDDALVDKKSPEEVIKLLGLPDSQYDNLFYYDLISRDNWRSKYGFNPYLKIEFKNDTVSAHYIQVD